MKFNINKIAIIILIVFTILIILGNFLFYIGYQIEWKYQIDLVRYMNPKDPNLIARETEIKSLLNCSIIIFIYSISILIYLVSMWSKYLRIK